MEIKIHISDTCQCCGGMCRVPVGMDIDAKDQPYMRHTACPVFVATEVAFCGKTNG